MFKLKISFQERGREGIWRNGNKWGLGIAVETGNNGIPAKFTTSSRLGNTIPAKMVGDSTIKIRKTASLSAQFFKAYQFLFVF